VIFVPKNQLCLCHDETEETYRFTIVSAKLRNVGNMQHLSFYHCKCKIAQCGEYAAQIHLKYLRWIVEVHKRRRWNNRVLLFNDFWKKYRQLWGRFRVIRFLEECAVLSVVCTFTLVWLQ